MRSLAKIVVCEYLLCFVKHIFRHKNNSDDIDEMTMGLGWRSLTLLPSVKKLDQDLFIMKLMQMNCFPSNLFITFCTRKAHYHKNFSNWIYIFFE